MTKSKTPYELLRDYFFTQSEDRELASNEADNVISFLDENELMIVKKNGLT